MVAYLGVLYFESTELLVLDHVTETILLLLELGDLLLKTSHLVSSLCLSMATLLV